MARISGVDIPRNKRILVSLTYIYGIGPSVSGRILKEAGIEPSRRTHELTDAELSTIVRTNIDSVTWMTRAVLPSMKRRKWA